VSASNRVEALSSRAIAHVGTHYDITRNSTGFRIVVVGHPETNLNRIKPRGHASETGERSGTQMNRSLCLYGLTLTHLHLGSAKAQVRAAFIDTIAAPIANTMFDCGIIP
jgi:hypothetical protein